MTKLEQLDTRLTKLAEAHASPEADDDQRANIIGLCDDILDERNRLKPPRRIDAPGARGGCSNPACICQWLKP